MRGCGGSKVGAHKGKGRGGACVGVACVGVACVGVVCVGVACVGGACGCALCGRGLYGWSQFLNFFNLLSLSFVIPVNIRPILNADIFS